MPQIHLKKIKFYTIIKRKVTKTSIISILETVIRFNLAISELKKPTTRERAQSSPSFFHKVHRRALALFRSLVKRASIAAAAAAASARVYADYFGTVPSQSPTRGHTFFRMTHISAPTQVINTRLFPFISSIRLSSPSPSLSLRVSLSPALLYFFFFSFASFEVGSLEENWFRK